VCIWSWAAATMDIIIRSWHGVDTHRAGGGVSRHMVRSTSLLALLARRHLTLPRVHYFHPARNASFIRCCSRRDARMKP